VVRHPFFAVTAADGKLALTGLPAGTFVLEAGQEAAGRAEKTVTLRDGTTASVDLVFSL